MISLHDQREVYFDSWQVRLKHLLHYAISHSYSIWLFTFTDLKTILGPSVTFGILNSIAISLDRNTTLPSNTNFNTSSQILSRAPLVILWVWINLLPFAIDNQRQPESIKEDALNKPWRPLPSQRMTPESARYLMIFLYCTAVIISHHFGNLAQCLALILLGYCYNDLNDPNMSCVLRNFINACGYTCFSSGAMQVAVGGYGSKPFQDESALGLRGWWFVVLACVIFSTVQTQDMYDQRGDAVRGRKTVPLVLGDGPARWTIAIPMVLWSWMTPLLWNVSLFGYFIPVLLGFIVAVRTLSTRTELGDKATFRVWNLWIAYIYSLPLIGVLQA